LNLSGNFGMRTGGDTESSPLMKLAAKFKRPVVTMLDTPGAYPGLEAEERGQAEAIARNLFEMSHLPVPIIVVIIGEGASGGALGIGVGDRILMMENTWYSVISPESCSSIPAKGNTRTGAEALAPPPPTSSNRIVDRITPNRWAARESAAEREVLKRLYSTN
jgi:acetyl-CoA carboxylase carboxyl transferase subunit alpha